MASPVDVVRSLYEASGRGDFETALSLIHPDIEWQVPAGYPYRGAKGLPELQRAMGDMADLWEDFRPVPQQFMDAGEGRVWVVALQIGRGRRTGRPFNTPSADYWEVRDGKIVRHVVYADTKVLAEATFG
ncbi:nuclear transport factor 2 family protein [Hyalangium gracile]|uniref:nuclear transport factor 2 family protein n=1 Tax=Hyalangium gracile TaxID=394092 RepID=UPI001CCDD244|nr:nuclear transport factor 2 family protein [Hyalangium gracile]